MQNAQDGGSVMSAPNTASVSSRDLRIHVVGGEAAEQPGGGENEPDHRRQLPRDPHVSPSIEQVDECAADPVADRSADQRSGGEQAGLRGLQVVGALQKGNSQVRQKKNVKFEAKYCPMAIHTFA